jgi:hypothetical protein
MRSKIAILVLRAPSQDFVALGELAEDVLLALETVKPGTVVKIEKKGSS